MSQLIHIAVSPAPSGGTAYFGMRHVPDYREDITGYEIVSADTGMACDVFGELMKVCAA